jgi:choline dehydrogenase-like flavoprotein
MPAATLAQAPRSRQFVQPPNPPMYAGKLLAEGARRLGYHAPFPMAVHCTSFNGRPPCNSCGFCSGFGCPINARGGAAVSFLHHAMQAGAELRTRCFVRRLTVGQGRRSRTVTGVEYVDASGQVPTSRLR